MTSKLGSRWKDLVPEAKVYVQFLSLYATNRLWFFTSHIEQGLFDRLKKEGKPIAKHIGGRLREELATEIGRGMLFSLVLELYGIKGEDCRPHIHGFILLDDEKQCTALRKALHHSCGQGLHGKKKEPSAVHIRKVYGEQERLAAYICKYANRAKLLDRRNPFFSSQTMTSFAGEIWESIRPSLSALT